MTATDANTMSAEAVAAMINALQAELDGVKSEMGAKVASLEESVTGLAHENALLKRRLYGKKTERSHTGVDGRLNPSRSDV